MNGKTAKLLRRHIMSYGGDLEELKRLWLNAPKDKKSLLFLKPKVDAEIRALPNESLDE